MGDFDLSRFRLGAPDEFRLRLDPGIEAEMQRLGLLTSSGRFRQLCLTPDWRSLQQSELDRWLRQPPTPPRPPLVPRGAGPATPRAGEVSDILQGVWRIPAVQGAAQRVSDRVTHQLSRDFRNLTPSERALGITFGVVITGTALAGVLANRDARQQAFDLIKDRNIPVPGVEGLRFRISDHGATVNTPTGITGLSVRGSFNVNDSPGRRVDYEGFVTFDVARFLRASNVAW